MSFVQPIERAFFRVINAKAAIQTADNSFQKDLVQTIWNFCNDAIC